MNHVLDPIVKDALSLLANTFQDAWNGKREREIVSLFCFGHLIHQCKPNAFLHDPSQIGIEVPVPQIESQSSLSGLTSAKTQVCKDIVIWPHPRMTCWDDSGCPTVAPTCIIEWKHNERNVSKYDIQWMTKFSHAHPDFVGYAVCTQDKSFGNFRLSCSRISQGEVEHRWIFIS